MIDEETIINAEFDGKFIWIQQHNTYNWFDGQFGHEIVQAMCPETFHAIVECVSKAFERYHYLIEVVPTWWEEWGDMYFIDRDRFVEGKI